MSITVAVVGRPNVGKSTFFNRLIGERISIVEDMPGVTRDRIYSQFEYNKNTINLIDTGGIVHSKEIDPLIEDVKMQADLAMDEADVIVMLCSAKDGVTNSDKDLANYLKTTQKPIILGINKVDNDKLQEIIYEFYELGIGTPLPISSLHGIGIYNILDEIIEYSFGNSDFNEELEKIKFTLIGRPNVGKSSLLNKIIGENRSIVSDVDGTTRDSVDFDFENSGQKYQITDTAGIRKRGKVYEKTEKYSVIRSYKAIDNSDVVALLIDADEGVLEQDKKIIGYAFEKGKGIILVVNKWDLISKDDKTQQEYTKKLRSSFHFLQFAKIMYVSALTGKGVNKILDSVSEVYENYSKKIPTGELNSAINDALLTKSPPARKGRKLNILYVTQADTNPPLFIVFVNDKTLFHFSYKRYLINVLRNSFDFEGTPIKIIARNRSLDE